jgi:cobalt-zinc-cadmium efflux system membrane fusion protein
MFLKNLAIFIVLAVSGLWLSGCGKPANDPRPVAATDTVATEEGHVHGEWWCGEHGVPEEVCAQCDISLVADFKAKGDWCDEHNRPDSQCFICHPEKEAEFAAQYEAKYGEKPPKPSEAGEEHHGHEHEHAENKS